MAIPMIEAPEQLTAEIQKPSIHSEILNPLVAYKDLVPFDTIRPKHFVPAIETLLQNVEPKLSSIEHRQHPTWDSIMAPLEAIEEEIHRVVGPMIHLKMVMDSYELRQAWSQVEPLWTDLMLRIKQSKPLYKAYKQIREGEEWNDLVPAQKRILEGRLMQAELSGIGLEGEKKKRFNELISHLNELQSKYNANVLDAIKNFSLIVRDKKLMDGVPENVFQLASNAYNYSRLETDPISSPEEGPWKLSLNPPVYLPVMRHCINRDVREKLYRGQILKASIGSYDNSENIVDQLSIRKEMARILGFNSYADLSLTKKMAPDVKTVKTFLHELRDASWDAGKKDLEEIEQFAQEAGFTEPLMPWDCSFWGERLKEEKFNLSEDELKDYFPLPKVLNGLFDLCHTLFGITIQPAHFKAPVWHMDVSYYTICDEEGEQIAAFYLDPYSRPQTKRGGAWMDSCRNRYISGEVKQNPIAYIVCNATPPIEETPALFSFREVETLFHEFGHALQHMLTEVDYASVSGINGVEWDAVEMVSQFMENWCYHPATLKKITSHYITKEPLPDEYIEKILEARTYQAGLGMLAQLKYGMTDLVLHDQFDPYSETSPFKIWYDMCEFTSHIPCLEEDRFLCSFHHIFGDEDYAAGYYSYKWAEVLSADAFSAFEEAGLENESAIRHVGKKFKETFLQLGGSLHPMEVFRHFRGRDPRIEPLLEHNGFARK